MLDATLRIMCATPILLALVNCGADSDGSAPSPSDGSATHTRQNRVLEVSSQQSSAGMTPTASTGRLQGATGGPKSQSDADRAEPANAPPVTVPKDAKFVDFAGNDQWEGTESRPWRHILPSLQKLQPGDTLVIRGGTYLATGSSELCGNGVAPFGILNLHGTSERWTTIMGYPGERPKLYNPDGWQTLYVCNSSYVRIRHLEVLGEANVGNRTPANGVYVVGSHHVVVEDVWSHDNGGCGICATESNHVTVRDCRVWGNSHWNPYHSSGISLYRSTNDGGGDAHDGYSNWIIGNMVWNNYEDESLGIGQQWGVTDGNGIIVDRNKDSGAMGRTLVADNILADNGGPGVMITHSHNVDVFHNTLFRNVRTRVPTVKNNGEIGCNGGSDVRIENNIVIPRDDNENLFQNFSCREISHANNVWVRSRAPRHGRGDIVIATGTQILTDPQLVVPAGDWTPIGEAIGYGAR